MRFGEAVNSCLRKYVEFGGRAPRSEYWFFYLFLILLIIPLTVLMGVAAALDNSGVLPGIAIALMVLLFMAIFLPMLAVTVRRLHDINMSGWWYLIAFVPFGSIVLFVFTVLPSTPGANRFGPDPFENVADVFS